MRMMTSEETNVTQEERLKYLIKVWEDHGNTEEELLIDDLELDVQIETVEHMLKMKGLEF